MKYNPAIVVAFFTESGLLVPEVEYRFHPDRKWRFDFAWPDSRVYLEVDGGIYIAGAHNRGARIKKDWEKRNAATVLGWRGLWCEPRDLCTAAMVMTIGSSL